MLNTDYVIRSVARTPAGYVAVTFVTLTGAVAHVTMPYARTTAAQIDATIRNTIRSWRARVVIPS